jgi:hypothetical protein
MFFWLLFCLIIIAWLIRYSAKPSSSYKWKIARTIIAFSTGYIITAVWGIFQYKYLHIISTREIGAGLIHGFWFIILYIGFWEWLWRKHYKEALKDSKHDFINNTILFISKIILFGLVVFIIFALIMTLW